MHLSLDGTKFTMLDKDYMSKPLQNTIKECLNEVLNDMAHSYPEELNVYDFDDTLFKTDGTIHLVNRETGERRELHPHEFHEYHLQPHEEFDLSDFNTLVNPQELPHLKRMQADYARLGPHGVTICTARPDANPVIAIMSTVGMPDIEVVAIGDSAPRGDVSHLNSSRKKAYLKSKILQRGLRILRFFDDNVDNVKSAKTLADEFPDVQIEVELVPT